jgi:hypothetical protein
MAGSRSPKPSHDQYALDFESAYAERHALLLSAVRLSGLVQLTPLARLVFNMQERSGGAPLAWPVSRYATEFGRAERTVQRWLKQLAAGGLIEIVYRPKPRGGQETNLVSIDWAGVRQLAVGRKLSADRGDKQMSPRAVEMSPRPAVVSPSIKESPSELPSAELNTTTTTALLHAQPLPHAAEVLSEEEEIFLRKLIKICYEKIPGCPRMLERAMRTALDNGCSLEQLRARCRWYSQHWAEWPAEHRPGAFHTGLAEATPDLPAHQGWPYQR